MAEDLSPNVSTNAQPGQTIKTTVVVSTINRGLGDRGAIFTAQELQGRWIKVVANYDRIPRPPLKGETWEVIGQFVEHAKYGKQLYAEYARPIRPPTGLIVRHLGTHPVYRKIGLGKGKIAELYNAFGDRLSDILNNGDSVSLSQVLSPNVAQKLVAKWRERFSDSAVISFLEEHHIAPHHAVKIIRYWGEQAVEKLRNNPYRLQVLMPWKQVDAIARSIGVGQDDQRRLVAAVEAWAYYRLDARNDTLVDEADLITALLRFFNTGDEATARRAIHLALAERAVEGDSASGYQTVGCAFMERFVSERLNALLQSVGDGEISLFSNFANYDNNTLVERQIGLFEQNEKIRLNTEQRSAIYMAVACPLSVLKGGAGVGKTSVLKAVHQVMEAMHQSVFQMALAGRAAQRMREATGREAYTVVGFLNGLKNGNITLKPGDLLIIDEASMLDLILVYRLLRALPNGVRLLFVGDPFQLPPIGPGLIFHVLASTSGVPSTELVEVHRQAASTGIPQFARAVRDGLVPAFTKYDGLGAGVSFIKCPRASIVINIVEIIAALNGFDETRILGLVKNGTAGVHQINDVFHRLLTSHQPSLYRWNLAVTDPIIYTKNDYERELFNGSLGTLRTVFQQAVPSLNDYGGKATVRAVAEFDGREVELNEDTLGDVELAYAITVHKAQGSQFKRVVIPLTKSRLLDRTILYTALTRGIEQVVFVGDQQAFEQAVGAEPTASLRRVGFAIQSD